MSMKNQRLLTIILNYKTPEMTLEAVAAARVAMAAIDGEIVLVDNDSQDGSAAKMQAHINAAGWGAPPLVRLLQSGDNGGFGAGNNFGIRAGLSDGSQPDLIYVLNSDAFPAQDAVSQLIQALEANPQAGFAGSYIHGPSGEAHFTAFRFPSIASELEGAARLGPISRLLHRYRVPLALPEVIRPVDWLAGASLLMRRDVLDQIGLFDEEFFLYFEETDLCLRARRAGWQTLYVPGSKVSHIGSVSTGMKRWQRVPDYWYASRLHYFRKNHGHTYTALATAAHVFGALIWRFRRLVQRKPRVEPPYFLRNLVLSYVKSLAFRHKRGRGPASGKQTSRTGG